MSFIAGAVRWIFGRIDWVVYGLIENVFQLIIDLANVEIFSDSIINDFARRLYIILGLVMIFKLMISFIQIIVNPDKMDDKEQGVGNILKRVIISLALIVLVPSIFDLARQVQNYVVPIIPKVILGATINPDMEDEDNAAMMEDVGRYMSFYTFLPFFGYDNPTCDDGSILGIGSSEEDGSNVSIISVASATTWANLTKTDNCSADSNNFVYTYRMGISTVVGVYLLWTLVNVGIYVAIRALKLAICEFVAPIPIASYIDPKTSKQAFDNWVHTSVTTYLDLFINLIGVYFVAFVFLTVFNTDTLTTIYAKLGGSMSRGLFVTLFIIIGLIKFLKEAPKFITGMLGIKEGSGNLSAIFKGAGSMFATAASLPRTAYVGARDSVLRSRAENEEGGLTALRGAAGLFGASGRMIASRLKGKSVKESHNAAIEAVHSKTDSSVKRSRAFANPDHTVDISSLRRGYMAQRADTVAAKRGLATAKQGYDYSVSNIESVTSTVEQALSDTSGNKVVKYWQNRYEAAKNVGLDVFEKEAKSTMKQQLLASGYSNADADARLERSASAIRSDAQRRQAEYVNAAQKAVSDAQTRLLEYAATGNANVLTAEDLSGSGLDAAGIYADGGILGRVHQDLTNAQASLNDKRRDDSRLNNFLGNADVDFTTMTGGEMKTMRDAAKTEASRIKSTPEYHQASFTDSHKNDKN